jgi:hypothetical protein
VFGEGLVFNRAEYGGEFAGNEGLLRDLINAADRVLQALGAG